MSPLLGAAVAFVVLLTAHVAGHRLARAPVRLTLPTGLGDGRAPEISPWRARFVASHHREAALATLLEEVASGVRAGTSLLVSLRDVASVARPMAANGLSGALARVDRGATLVDGLEHWRDTADDAPSRLSAKVLAHVASLGGADPRPIEAIADSLRERVALRGELRTQAAQARASAVVLSVLPPAFLLVVAAADGDVADVVLRTPLGWGCLATGLVLDLTGALWMARIVRGAGG